MSSIDAAVVIEGDSAIIMIGVQIHLVGSALIQPLFDVLNGVSQAIQF